jgi:hypothetical protein
VIGPRRLVIAGGPRTGKSTLARKLAADMGLQPNSETNDAHGVYGYGLAVRSTDELIGQKDWSGASAEVARWMDAPGPWILEGVVMCRALRKWLAAHPTGSPCDEVLYVCEAKVPQTPGQQSMTKGCLTVFGDIESALERRGVVIQFV